MPIPGPSRSGPPRPARRRAALSTALLLAAAAVASVAAPPAARATGVLSSFEAEIQRIRDRLRPSVASVEAHRMGNEVLVGAGVVADIDGRVVTTASVVRDAIEIRVYLPDRGEAKAAIVGIDPITNLAVVDVDGSGFVPAPIAAGGESPAGSWVMVLGNSYGAGPTISVGVLSGRRPCYGLDEHEGLLQINAPVNPGDSGAALVNSRGEVIGIVCAAVTPRENPEAGSLVGGEGDGPGWGSGATVGFAFPMRAGQAIVDQIRSRGRVVRGYLGLEIHTIPAERAPAAAGPARPTLRVTAVAPSAPAARAGFRIGDVILGVNGAPIDSPRRLQRLVEATPPQSPLAISILRDGAAQDLTAVIDEMPVAFAEERIAPRAARRAAPRETALEQRAKILRRIDALESELAALRRALDTAQATPPPP
jgi:serine protease Do